MQMQMSTTRMSADRHRRRNRRRGEGVACSTCLSDQSSDTGSIMGRTQANNQQRKKHEKRSVRYVRRRAASITIMALFSTAGLCYCHGRTLDEAAPVIGAGRIVQNHAYDDEHKQRYAIVSNDSKYLRQQQRLRSRRRSQESSATRERNDSITQTQATMELKGDVPISIKDGYTLLTVSLAMKIVLYTLLSLVTTFLLFLTISVLRNRRVPALQLAQPTVLVLFLLSGIMALSGSYFLVDPRSDWSCAVRQPIIMTALSFSGSVLAARVWRISSIMAPILALGNRGSIVGGGGGFRSNNSADDDGTSLSRDDSANSLTNRSGSDGLSKWQRRRKIRRERILSMKRMMMHWMSILSNWKRMRMRIKFWLTRGCCSCRGQGRRSGGIRRQTAMSIRRKVPLDRLLFLVFILMIPQLLLQLLNLTVPSMREELSVQYDDLTQSAYCHCVRPSGLASVIVGFVLIVAPYGLTFLLSLESEGLPDVFDELKGFIRAVHIILIMGVGAAPAYLLSTTPDVMSYLLTYVVLGSVVAPTRFIVLRKMKPIWRGEKTVLVSSLLRRMGTDFGEKRRMRRYESQESGDGDEESSGATSLMDRHRTRQQEEANEKAGNLALTIGKMYEEMGQNKKSIKLFDDALALWHNDRNRHGKAMVGEFTIDEVNAFSQKDVVMVVQLLIAKGRVLGTFSSESGKGQADAAQAWLDALEVFAKAPAAQSIKDRQIVFPCFSGIFIFLKGGKIQRDEHFEADLVRQFVSETKKHGDPVHYARALAMKAEVSAKMGFFDQALEAFELMKMVYIIEEHSDKIAKEYGSDRCSQSFSLSAVWYAQIGKQSLAESTCEYVIHTILPQIDPSNVLGLTVTLLPIIRHLKWKGQAKRMRELYETYVVRNYERYFKDGTKSPARPLMKPMMLVLKICDSTEPYEGMDDDISYMCDGDNGVCPAMLDSIYTSLCWSMNSLSAEICLHLAKKIVGKSDYESQLHILIRKGVGLARKADSKMKDEEGNVKLPIAYETALPILEELEALAASNHVDLSISEERRPRRSTPRAEPVRAISDRAIASKKSSLDMLKSGLFSSKKSSARDLRTTSMQHAYPRHAATFIAPRGSQDAEMIRAAVNVPPERNTLRVSFKKNEDHDAPPPQNIVATKEGGISAVSAISIASELERIPDKDDSQSPPMAATETNSDDRNNGMIPTRRTSSSSLTETFRSMKKATSKRFRSAS